jgi:hypothetical protein
VWEEELQIRVNSKTDAERKKATQKQKPKYHAGREKRLQRYGDGWARQWTRVLPGMVRNF